MIVPADHGEVSVRVVDGVLRDGGEFAMSKRRHNELAGPDAESAFGVANIMDRVVTLFD